MRNENEIEAFLVLHGLTAERVTPKAIDATIASAQFHVFEGTCLTVCCLTLKNGFNVVGESACAHPDNFNPVIGREIAFNNARDKIWPLEGYLLKQRLSDSIV